MPSHASVRILTVVGLLAWVALAAPASARDGAAPKEVLALKAVGEGVWSVSFSPDGARLLRASGQLKQDGKDRPGVVEVWDARTGKRSLAVEGHGGFSAAAAFSPDGKHIVNVADGPESGGILSRAPELLNVRDAKTGKVVRTLEGGTKDINGVAFSPDGKRIVVASGGLFVKSLLTAWDVGTGKRVFSVEVGNGIFGARSPAFSPDGRRIVAATEIAASVWDAKTGKELVTFKGHKPGGLVFCAAFSPDGERVVSAVFVSKVKEEDGFAPVGEVKVWKAASGKEEPLIKGYSASVLGVSFSPDGKRIATASGGLPSEEKKPLPGEVKVWDARTGKELLGIKGPAGGFWSVAFSPDGKRLAVVGIDGAVKVWVLPSR